MVGGWKEGRSKDSVLDQLTGVLSEALLSAKVLEIRLFGRCPTAGKVVLKFPPDLSMSEKRRQQMEVRDTLASKMTAPLWCSIDKPPELRQVGKGVAMLADFLSTKLGIGKQNLEVGSWTQAKFFLGENRVTRKVDNNQLHGNEKMLLQHAKTGVSIVADVHEIARFEQSDAILKCPFGSFWPATV